MAFCNSQHSDLLESDLSLPHHVGRYHPEGQPEKQVIRDLYERRVSELFLALRSNGEDLLRNDIHSKTIKLASQMISDQVIPEEDRTQSSAGPNDLANSLIKQFSLIEKGSTPLMRPSLKSKTNFRKATSLYVDTPNKFGTGDKTTLGGMSGMSRQSQVSTLQIESFCTHMQSVSQVLQSKNIRELMANITVAMRRVFKA